MSKNTSDKKKNLYHYYEQIPIIKNKLGMINLKFNKKIDTVDLPNISIVTITRDRLNFWKAGLPIFNFENIDYPKEKIEWVIIDDSKSTELKKLIPNDSRIRYVYINKEKDIPLKISFKRNVAVKYTKYNYIIHMDDDDYYPKDSVKNRVMALLDKNKKCVGSSIIPVYNLRNKVSYILTENRQYLLEGTLCYTKQFWNENKFNYLDNINEGLHFLNNRYNDIIEIPGISIMYCFIHGNNYRFEAKKENFNKKFSYEKSFPKKLIDILKII